MATGNGMSNEIRPVAARRGSSRSSPPEKTSRPPAVLSHQETGGPQHGDPPRLQPKFTASPFKGPAGYLASPGTFPTATTERGGLCTSVRALPMQFFAQPLLFFSGGEGQRKSSLNRVLPRAASCKVHSRADRPSTHSPCGASQAPQLQP